MAIDPRIFIGGVGTLVAIGVFILALSLMGSVVTTYQDLQGTTFNKNVTNESVTANASLSNSGTPTITNNIDNETEIVHNGTGGGEILTRTTHYTLTKAGVLTILPEAAGTAGDVTVNVTYNYTEFQTDAAYNVSGSGISGTTNISDLIPTMGLVFGITLVLSILVIGLGGFFMRNMNR